MIKRVMQVKKKIITPNSISPSPKPGVITDSGIEFLFLKKKKAN